MKNHKFSQTSESRMEGVDPRLVEIARRALFLSPIDFGIPEFGGVRNDDEQAELFRKDLSKCDGVEKRSFHQPVPGGDGLGKALDFFAFVRGKESWQKRHLSLIAAAFLQAANELGYRVEWGGLWVSWQDYPHVQLID